MARAPRDHRAAACEGPRPPVKLARVSRHYPHIVDELGEHREVPLPLRADAGRAANLAARLDRDPRTLVRADAGAFDVAHNPDADMTAFSAQPRLLVAQEGFVAHDLRRLLERR